MTIEPGAHKLGAPDAELTVHTGRSGAAAKAGHDLLIVVTAWEATIVIAEDRAPSELSLNVDSRSLRVREGVGGIQSLGDDDKDNIRQTIDDEVLKGTPIDFRSTSVRPGSGPGRAKVEGELTLNGQPKPVSFELELADDGTLAASARIRQSEFGIKPYSALFGALKVADEVEIRLAGRIPQG
jgi:polyisoprenoid-binding protein YceI